jgi:hypothetical protein
LLYINLYEAGDRGLLTHEIENALPRTPYQFAGLTGALGRRISHTKELGSRCRLGITFFFDIVKEKNEYRYILRQIFRQVLEEEKIVLKE